MQLVARLTETSVLWFSFVATVLITIAFQVVIVVWDLVLLDGIADPEQARAAIAGMSEYQRNVHAWLTGTLDVVYPIAYGALFIGSAYRFFPRLGWLLAIPTFVLVPVDLVEGVVQVLALTEVADWVSSKAILTSLKQILFLAGFLITVCGWARWATSRLFGN